MRAFAQAAWTAIFAIVLTALTSLVWSVLVLANLSLSPSVPWAAALMCALLWPMWTWLGGKWGPARTQAARKTYLRATAISKRVFLTAVAAGTLSLVSLCGLWIVLAELVKMPGNAMPDLSRYPFWTVIVTLAVAALSGAVSEEAGFRGYFQGTLERTLPAPLAIAISAAVMAPQHALTQGFVWPTLLFYLLVDAMLGASAALSKSILPGIVTHAIGLFVFFALVWPGDQNRTLIWQHGADAWFWIHVAQAIVFAAFAIALFVRLATITHATQKGPAS
jgi:membrane protease YdiL (CAAX protease family)